MSPGTGSADSSSGLLPTPPMHVDSNSLLQRAVKAAAWGYAGAVLRLLIQIGSQIVLARLLGPTEYGLFAIAVITISLSVFASDIASSALIHTPQLNDGLIRFAFTLQTLCGLALSVTVALLAQPLADWLKQPDVARVILISAPICLLSALGGVALALLRRQLSYGTIQIWQTAGYFVGYVLLGIPLAAYTDIGVWALVTAWGTQTAVATIGYIWRSPHAWKPLLTYPDAKPLVKFGLQAMLANFSNWGLSNIDRLIVARTAPIREMGLYSTMINLLSTPLAQILGTYQSVAFSATARSTEDSAKNTFIVMLAGGSLIVCMLFGTVLAIPDTIIQVLYGPKWADAAPYMTAFSLGFIAYGIQATITPLLWGRGAVEREAIPQFVMALLLGLTAWVASNYSTLAVAWAFAAVNVIRCIWIIGNGITTFRAPIRVCVHTLIRSVLIGAIVGVSLWITDHSIRQVTTNPFLYALADAVYLAALAFIGIAIRHFWIHPQITTLLRKTNETKIPASNKNNK